MSSEDFFLPSVIIWNPYIIYPHIFPPGSIKCFHCGMSMHEGYWNDGSSTDKQPRILHGIENTVILVSAVYVCDNRHKLLAHDEIVLDKFPSKNMIPFLLLHRTGFTRELTDLCTALCRRGINFYNLESIIIERRWESFARQQELLQIHGRVSLQPVCLSEFWDSKLSKSPSNDVLSKCFLAEFLNHEKYYLKEMTCIPIGETTSFDHTFKVATNIGYLREDSKWISQYDGLFIVLNGNGQVLTWQLTKGTSFAHVKSLLQDLLKRPHQQIKTIYVDECCKLRAKIKSVFGPNIMVKLDLFHAVQRITKTLSKKHTLTRQCVTELRLVFRCDGDSGEKRLSHTPSPDVMLSKLDRFVTRWKDMVDDNGMKLFRSDTFNALENIRRHISAGCLSGIPPGGGTNRNERLHEHINSFFNRSRIGILLAYALLTMIFHSHNTSMKFGGKVVVRPITATPLLGTSVSMDIQPIGIMPKERERQQDLEHSDYWEKDKSISVEDYSSIRPIYQTSLQKLQIQRSLHKLKLTQMTKSIKYFQEVTSMVNSNEESNVDTEVRSRLSEYGLVLTPVVRDGNCFFHSVSMNIISDLDRWNTWLTKIGIVDKFDIGSLSIKLRQAFVQEILGERRESYESFLTNDSDYSTEANKFLQDGFYASSIGDLMPLAIATVLQASIVIIITSPNSHPIYVTPQVGSIEGTLILVYDPSGSGHYDAAVPYSNTVGQEATEQATVTNKSTSTSCRCGVNKKIGNVCAPNAVYASRCKCYLQSQPCTTLCCCKGCKNPYGVRVPKPKGVKRNRRPHSLQIALPTSKRFAVDRGESLSTSIWSDFESIILDEILSNHQDALSTTDITNTYNSIVYYSKSTFCSIPLEAGIIFREKTNNQISSRIEFVNKRTV